jgi:hypothetical protein
MLSNRNLKFLQGILLVCALGCVLTYIGCSFLRIGYPFQLEWQEGGVLHHVERVVSGHSLYVEPSLDFVPFIYTPFYYYVAAFTAKILGLGLPQLRLVSFLSSLGCLVLIFAIIRRKTGRWAPGVLAVGLFAGASPLGGAWLDIARVDSLFLLLLLSVFYIVYFKVSRTAYALAGMLFCLGFFTKQATVFAYLPLAILSVVMGGRTALVFILTSLITTTLGFLIINSATDGWFAFYTVALPSSHPWEFGFVSVTWIRGLLLPLGGAVAIGVVFLVYQFRSASRRDSWACLLLTLGLLAPTLFSGIHSGAYRNVLLPAAGAIAILFGLAAASAFEQNNSGREKRPHSAAVVFFVLSVLQFSWLALTYNPGSQIPTDDDRRAGETLVSSLKQIKGEVLIPRHGYLARYAGKKILAHEMAMNDLFRGGNHNFKSALAAEISQSIKEKRFSAIIVDYNWLRPDIERSYLFEKRLFENPTVFWTFTGTRTRPKYLYKPKPAPL